MIQVDQVTKRYGPTLAVDRVSFEVKEGEVVGFLGPNGAGKSTLLKMMCTWLPPTGGTIRIAGHDVRTEPLAVRRSIGYLPEHNPLYETMRVDRFLAFVAQMRGLPAKRFAERRAWVVEQCKIEEILTKRIQQCSKGFRQRLGLAAAILHDPPVVLLDEPTHGLDPLQVAAFLKFIRGLAKNHAILFSSHVLAEVVNVSDRLIAINDGRLLIDEAVSKLRTRAEESGRSIEDLILDEVRGSNA
jgi:ABC-2 type transport system ATP-binding protein